jgi:MFS family permease
VLSAALFLASSVGAALPQNITQFVIARFIGGIAIGVASAISPLYIAEISPPEIRGRLVTLNQLAIVSGILAAFVVNWWLSRFGAESWRWMFLAAAVPSLVFLLSLLVVPETLDGCCSAAEKQRPMPCCASFLDRPRRRR